MHTCIHAYMHTCIHAYMHTCIYSTPNDPVPLHNQQMQNTVVLSTTSAFVYLLEKGQHRVLGTICIYIYTYQYIHVVQKYVSVSTSSLLSFPLFAEATCWHTTPHSLALRACHSYPNLSAAYIHQALQNLSVQPLHMLFSTCSGAILTFLVEHVQYQTSCRIT